MIKQIKIANKQAFNTLLDLFSGLTHTIYERVPYEDWNRIIDFKEEYDSYAVEYGSKIGLITIDSDKFLSTKSLIYSIHDKSFGQFLYDKFFKEDEQAEALIASKTACNTECSTQTATSSISNKVDCTATNISKDLDYCADIFAQSLKRYGLNYEFDKNTYTINNKEKETMPTAITKNDFTKTFNFDFGPCGDNIHMSMYGMAIKNASGEWVSLRNGEIVNVEVFNFPAGKFMYKMPVAIKDVKVNDVLIHNRVPVFVTSVDDGIKVIDIYAGEKKEILLTKSMFNFDYATKVVSFLDFGKTEASADAPFGNMLPFLMMDGDEDFDPMMLMFAMNGGNIDFTKNPMMMYFLMKNSNNKDSMLPFLFMNMNN